MFHEGEVQRYARGGLDLRTSRQPHYIRQVIADSEPALAMVVMDQIRAERDCHFWDDEEDLDYWVEPLDAPMIGEEAVAYLYTSYRYRDDTFWEANVVVTRVGGTILFIIHGQLDDPPVEQETYEIARLATDKVALAVPTWEPVEPKSPEAEAAVESSGGVVWWAGGLPFFLSLPFMVYVYVNGVFVACQLSVVRATGLTVRYVVLIPMLVVRRGRGIRVSFRWLSPFSTVNPFVGASHSPDLDDEQMAAYLESSYRVNILVALGAAVTITLAVVAIRVSTDSSWILMVVLLIAPGSLLLSVIGTYRQWMAYRQMVREKNPSLVRAAAYNRVVWQALGGVRPRDWNATDIAKLQHYPDGAVDLVTVLGFALAHSCYLDRGDIQQARQTLHQTLSLTSALPPTQMPPVIHTMVTRAAVWFAARYERDAIHARGLLSQIKSSGIERYEERLVEASVMATEGRSEQARRMLESALRDIGDAVDPGSAVYMEEQARLMLAELDGATPSPSPTF